MLQRLPPRAPQHRLPPRPRRGLRGGRRGTPAHPLAPASRLSEGPAFLSSWGLRPQKYIVFLDDRRVRFPAVTCF